MKRKTNIFRRPRIWLTVEPIVLVFMFASFLTYPTFQQLLYHAVCSTTPNCTADSSDSCGDVPDPIQHHVRSKASHWILYNNLATSIPAILAALLYGALSDSLGRRPFIAIPALGGLLNAVLVIVISYVAPRHIYLYLIGSFISGVSGGCSVFNLAVYSYTADISVHSRRTSKIGTLESMMYFGASLSGLVGGVWIEDRGYVSPYWGILACYIAVIAYTLLLLPTPIRPLDAVVRTHSIGPSPQNIAEMRKFSSPLKSVLLFLKVAFASWSILLLYFMFFVVEINFLGIADIVILFSLNRPLCWSSDWIGYFLATKVFFNGAAALVLLPVLNTFFKASDTTIVFFGLVSGIGALVTMGTATHTWMMMLVPVIGAMRGCVVPVIRSMLSKLTPPNLQGVLFSGIGIVEAASMLIASAMYNVLFPVTYHLIPGFCFYLMALVLLLPLCCTLILHLKQKEETPQSYNAINREAQPLIR